MLKVFEISLPLVDNKGTPLAEAHKAFLGLAVRSYGGGTYHDATGLWVDDQGKLYDEPVRVYRFAVGPGQGDLAALAEEYFPDQLAFYVSEVGTAEIIAKGCRPSRQGWINKERG